MKALWIVPSNIKELASGKDPERSMLDCPIASVRMRTAAAALGWKRAGGENLFWNPEMVDIGQAVNWDSVSVCIVPKFFFDVPPKPWYEACLATRKNQCPLVLDICDYPFKKDPVVQAFYADTLKICDVLVVNSERMGELMAPHVSHRPRVIDDAILGVERNPEFAPAGRLRLLWFGHHTNLQYLDNGLEALVRFARQKPCRLTVVTAGAGGAEAAIQGINARFAPALEAHFVEWSLESMATALRRCDLVLIPSDPSDLLKAGVSANRIAEALKAGRFPVASPVPSYQAYADCAWLGYDLIEGIRWSLANPGEVRARIRRGQTRVGERLAPEIIGRQWSELFEHLANSRRPHAAPS